MGSGATMKSRSLRAAVFAVAAGSLAAGTNFVHVAPAYAQGVASTVRPTVGDAASAKLAVEAIITVYANVGNGSAAAIRAAITQLLLDNPGFAELITAAVIQVSTEGVAGVPANDSLTQVLAEGVASAVAVWQRAGGTSPVARAAIEGVNAAFTTAGVSSGSVFGVAFAVQLNRDGGVLLPPVLAPDSSSLALTLSFVPKDETSNLSPNTGGNL